MFSVPRPESDLKCWHKEIPIAPGIWEFFLTLRTDSTPSEPLFDRMEREMGKRFGENAEGLSITVFRPVTEASSDAFLGKIARFAPVAHVGGRGAEGFSLVATGYRFESAEIRTSSFERLPLGSGTKATSLRTPSITKTTLDAHVSEGDFAAQVDSFYDAVAEIVSRKNLASGDFVRSWNYVDSILSRYAEFNRIRDARFAEFGLSEYPAGTGIDAVLSGGVSMAAFAEFHSAGTDSAPKIVRYKTSSQCEAPDYGPKFSRAVSTEAGGWRRVHISGTASVGPSGQTLNSDDADRNIAHTMETVCELLSLAGAGFSDVVRSHAYFKRPEFVPRFDAWREDRDVEDFPCAFNVSDVCRDDWLFEFECVAFVPVRKGVFTEFGLPGETYGNKAENCRLLAEYGFPVPASLAVSGAAARRIGRGSRETLLELFSAFEAAFGETYRGKRYAVRSSSCAEDSLSDSKAGAFRSVLPVKFDDLPEAFATVRDSLENGSETADFGILVQEYVPLDRFGVCFTCDPEFSEHAMVAEISKGAGEALVSGKNLPDRVSFSRGTPVPKKFRKASGVDWEFWRGTFRRIESVFGCPQDVEWGVAENGEPVVLQSRPVTTLSSGEIGLLREFDRFETERPFGTPEKRYVRNELSEVFDEPNDEEFAFLLDLYRSEAVVSAYARWGITYSPRDFLVRIGGKLFIDAAKERACFDGLPSESRFAKVWTRTWNQWRLGAVGTEIAYGGKARLSELEFRMLESLEKGIALFETGYSGRTDALLELLYSPVFEANFLASSLRASVKDAIPLTPYVPENAGRWRSVFERIAKAGLVGNSLSFQDVSSFSTPLSDGGRFVESAASNDAEPRAVLDFLREAGRSVSVLISNASRIWAPSERRCERCPVALEFPAFSVRNPATGWTVLSRGEAVGKLAVLSEIPSRPEFPVILFVERLLPSLADSLPPGVVWVVSRTGGRLSHFAIVARERGLPTYADPSIRIGDCLGKIVRVRDSGMEICEDQASETEKNR